MMKSRMESKIIWIAILMFVALAGCSKVTTENYAKLQMGMEYQQVIALLGEPVHCDSVMMAKNCVWGTSPKTISIQLVSDKVALFQAEGL
jgi:uncharacterized protein YceK